VLEHILVCIRVEWRAHPVDQNNRSTTEYALVQTVPMNVVLDDNAMWNGHLVRWVCGRESHILTTEVVVIASKAHRMVRPVERFPQVVANRPRSNRRRGFQLERDHLRHAQRVNSEKQVTSARNGVTEASKGDTVMG
jgi:hypothetical protein